MSPISVARPICLQIFVASALFVAAYLSSPSSSEASPLMSARGDIAYRCSSSPSCDTLNAIQPTVNYSSACPRAACDVLAIANWESTSLPSFPPSVKSVHLAYLANPIYASSGPHGMLALLDRWTKTPIAGRSVSKIDGVHVDKSSIESAVFATGSMIAMLHSSAITVIGGLRYRGFIPVVVSGYDPIGPLVVVRSDLTQMTWAQWARQSVVAWLIILQSAKSVEVGTSTLTAVTISFNANGGLGSMSSEVAPATTPVVLTPNSFVLTGDAFNGWNTSPNGSGAPYANASVHSFAQSTTLYAQWIITPSSPTLSTTNWSGYLTEGVPVTSVTGSWTVPTLNCASTAFTNSSTWVGIGGWNTGSVSTGPLLQTGTGDVCNQGAQVDYAWWQEWPDASSTMNFLMAIRPGDSMSASVSELPDGAWETVISDITTGISGIAITGGSWGTTPISGGASSVVSPEGVTPVRSYSGGTSAEWIIEDMTWSTTLGTLANYGSVTLSNLSVNSAPWKPSGSSAVLMDQSGVVISMPTEVNANGFTASYQY